MIPDTNRSKSDKEKLANDNVGSKSKQDRISKTTQNGESTHQKREKSKTRTPTHAPSPPPSHPEPDTKYDKLRSKYRKAVENPNQIDQEEIALSQPQGNDEPTRDSRTHGLVPIPQPEHLSPRLGPAVSSALPEWLKNPDKVSPQDGASFSGFPIPPSTLEALCNKNYSLALPIQAALLPILLPGSSQYLGDICISAATGSGKTLAYALPMVETLKGKPSCLLRGLVVVPTRELVAQARETFLLCTHGSSLNIEMAVGSRSLKEEKELLIQKVERYDPYAYARTRHNEKANEGDELLLDYDIFDDPSTSPILPGYVMEYKSNVDILITTPGRLVEHINSTPGFTLQHVQWLVIDEADRLLDSGFQQWVDTVIPELEALPPLDEMQERIHRFMRTVRKRVVRKILLSATMTRDVGKLAALKLNAPKMVVLEAAKSEAELEQKEEEEEGEGETFSLPETLIEIAVPVKDSGDKPLYLIEILDK
ncbi:MAG: hypothetical protein Q9191_008325, partial [Dirinaria sp. TL-2023a]